MSGGEREMSLVEWVGKLPPSHRACRELAEQAAEIERLREHERLTDAYSKKDAFDRAVAECVQLRKRAERAEARVAELEEAKNGAYTERDMLVAALSKLLPARLGPNDQPEPGWTWIVFIDGPTGQLSWHIHDSELSWFDHLDRVEYGQWDGHSTVEKYARLLAMESTSAERAERERDEHKANEEFAREMLDRVVIQGGAESWTTREMRDWCCDCKDFKNGYPVSFIRAHADHANCGHRERDGQDEPADRWVHRKIERERDEARAKANRWDLLDSLLQREGASVEIHHHNPDFGGDANVVTYRYLLDGTQVDYRGESVEDCLRQIVAALSQREEEGRG